MELREFIKDLVLQVLARFYSFRKRRRYRDMRILWPKLVRQYEDIHQAKRMFHAYCIYSDYWRDVSNQELSRFIRGLTQTTRRPPK